MTDEEDEQAYQTRMRAMQAKAKNLKSSARNIIGKAINDVAAKQQDDDVDVPPPSPPPPPPKPQPQPQPQPQSSPLPTAKPDPNPNPTPPNSTPRSSVRISIDVLSQSTKQFIQQAVDSDVVEKISGVLKQAADLETVDRVTRKTIIQVFHWYFGITIDGTPIAPLIHFGESYTVAIVSISLILAMASGFNPAITFFMLSTLTTESFEAHIKNDKSMKAKCLCMWVLQAGWLVMEPITPHNWFVFSVRLLSPAWLLQRPIIVIRRDTNKNEEEPRVHFGLINAVRDMAFLVSITMALVILRRAMNISLISQLLVLAGGIITYTVLNKQLRNRDHVLNEIRSTELTYGRALTKFVKVYPTWLSQHGVPRDDIDLLLEHLLPILELSIRFNQELRLALAFDDLGPCFQRICPFFKLYAPYCASHATRLEAMERIMNRDGIQDGLVTLFDSDDSLQPISSYLIMPIQRIPRYVLLLSDLVRKTPTWHRDRVACQVALSHVESVAVYINDAIAVHETVTVRIKNGHRSRRLPFGGG